MSNAIHYGIIGNRPIPKREWPKPLITNGDSFLVWGEERNIEGDFSLHLLEETQLRPYVRDTSRTLQASNDAYKEGHDLEGQIKRGRELIRTFLDAGERLVDYVVVSDWDDWSEKQETFVLENFA